MKGLKVFLGAKRKSGIRRYTYNVADDLRIQKSVRQYITTFELHELQESDYFKGKYQFCLFDDSLDVNSPNAGCDVTPPTVQYMTFDIRAYNEGW